MSGRWEIALLLAGAAIVGSLAYVAQRPEPLSVPSTYDTGPNGYRALFDTLRAAGVRVRRFEYPIARLAPSTGVLVIAGSGDGWASSGSRAQERATLRTFVQRGGRLVVLRDRFSGAADVVPKVAGSVAIASDRAVVLARDADTTGVRDVAAPVRSAFPLGALGGIPLLATPEGIVAMRYRIGRGDVVAIAAPDIWSNAHVASAGNLRFAYDLLARHGAVAFDEYVHGYARTTSTWAVLPGQLRAAIWIGLLVLLLALVGANVPFATALPARPPDERGTGAYLDAMASLLQHSDGARVAIAAFARDVEERHLEGSRLEGAMERLEALRARRDPTDGELVAAARIDFVVRKGAS